MQVKIGKIVKPQGLKGEVKIQLSTNNLAVFNNLRAMYIGPSSAEIEYLRLKDNFVIVKFKQINDIDKAELLRGKEVFVDKKDFVLEQDNYLIEDLIDCSVYDENNNFIGKFVDVEQYGAADIWIIYADGRDYYVPFLKQIFTKVLPQQKIIIINKKAFDENKISKNIPIYPLVVIANSKTIIDKKYATKEVKNKVIKYDQLNNVIYNFIENGTIDISDNKMTEIAEVINNNNTMKTIDYISKLKLVLVDEQSEEDVQVIDESSNIEDYHLDDELYERLREYRLNKAKELNVQAWIIFNNDTLSKLVL